MNLIILTDEDRLDDGRYAVQDHRAEHIRTVLKAQVGSRVEVGLLDGPSGSAVVSGLTDGEVILSPVELRSSPLPSPEIDLICALPRPQTLRKVLRTVATMGVRSLHLVRANRVERSYFHSPLLEPSKQRPYLLEGLAQGKQTRLPIVTVHDRFKPFFEDKLPEIEKKWSQPSLKLLADPEASGGLDSVLDRGAAHLAIALGPEGGWVPYEIELMEGIGFRRFTLSRYVLRVETAVTAALAQVELLARMR